VVVEVHLVVEVVELEDIELLVLALVHYRQLVLL
tara:strand:+ start:570 stop:671 length:102 start_codon:yes stop_codon:yes gene_type:complete